MAEMTGTIDHQQSRRGRARHGGRSIRSLTAIAVAAVAALLAGCAGEAPAEPTGFPDTPSGAQAAWVVSVINGEEITTEEEAAARFADSFLDVVPASQLIPVFEQYVAAGPWSVGAIDDDGTRLSVRISSTAAGEQDLYVVVDAEGLMEGLQFVPVQDAHTPAESWRELEERAAALGVETNLLVVQLDQDGRRSTLAETGEGGAMPSGSIFKLYVLAALGDAITEGELDWDDTVTITDAVRSLPSGTYQDLPAGTEVTVQEAATKMISISDNTATDLLISQLTQDRLRGTVGNLGGEPSRFEPFLGTRELFQLGWGEPDVRERWAGADAAQREAILAEVMPAGNLDIAVEDVTEAVWPSGIDWFITPEELVELHLLLQEALPQEAAVGEPIRAILSENPGVAVDSATWPYVAFKGGSSMGSVAGSWYAEHEDGRRIVVIVQLASEDVAAVQALQPDFLHLAQDAFALAG